MNLSLGWMIALASLILIVAMVSIVVRILMRDREYFRNVFDHSPIGIEIYDASGKLLNINRAALDIFGVAGIDAVKGFNLFADPNVSDEIKERLRRGETAKYEAPFDFDKVTSANLYTTTKSGSIFLEVSLSHFSSLPSGGGAGYIVLINDITERKTALDKVRHQESFLKQVIESIDNPFYVIDVTDYTVKLANSATGFAKLPPGSTCYALTHQRGEPCWKGAGHPCPIREVIKSKKSVVTEHVHYDQRGNARYYEVHGHPIFDAAGKIVQMVEYSLDITERKRMEGMLRKMATVDELTGLYNRRGFIEMASNQILLAHREGKQVILFFMDMDKLKQINDTFGHDHGDRALVEINEILRYTFRASDVIARIGGDEFAVVSIENVEDTGQSIMERLQENVDAWNSRANREYYLSLSAGATMCPPGQKCSVDELLQKADRQMYEQKLRKKQNDLSSKR